MADTRISNLPAVTTPLPTDEFAVNQGGVSKKATLLQVQDASYPGQFVDNDLVLQADILLPGSSNLSFVSPFVGITAAFAPDALYVPNGYFRLQYSELILDGLDEATINGTGEVVLFDWGPRDLVVA
jgi:hypothetical protein